jgi:thiamine pyrophosphate-dependent acetolactate synthase large subunit-like protein
VAELNRWLPDDTLILEEATVGLSCTLRQLERPPGHLFRSRAANPGWSMAAAFGAQLARPAQPVIAVCDDASFASALPSAAFWSAHRAAAPFMTVVLDRSAGRAHEPGEEPGQDVATMARAGGAEVLQVDSVNQVAAAVERLLATTRDGVCTVMDVRLPIAHTEEVSRPRRRRNPLTTASTVTKRGA